MLRVFDLHGAAELRVQGCDLQLLGGQARAGAAERGINLQRYVGQGDTGQQAEALYVGQIHLHLEPGAGKGVAEMQFATGSQYPAQSGFKIELADVQGVVRETQNDAGAHGQRTGLAQPGINDKPVVGIGC